MASRVVRLLAEITGFPAAHSALLAAYHLFGGMAGEQCYVLRDSPFFTGKQWHTALTFVSVTREAVYRSGALPSIRRIRAI